PPAPRRSRGESSYLARRFSIVSLSHFAKLSGIVVGAAGVPDAPDALMATSPRGIVWSAFTRPGATPRTIQVSPTSTTTTRSRRRPRGEARAWRRAAEALRNASSLEFPDALGGRDDVGQTNAELLVHDHDLALGDEAAVDEDVHRLAGETVELDHRALRELKQ